MKFGRFAIDSHDWKTSSVGKLLTTFRFVKELIVIVHREHCPYLNLRHKLDLDLFELKELD